MYIYSQCTGRLTQNNLLIGICYSGHGKGLNNPTEEIVKGEGPIPQGMYTISDWHNIPHLGPIVTELVPSISNEMFGRSGFFIHGDNSSLDYTASDGCIIAGHAIRDYMSKNGDTQLQVVQ